MSTLGYAGYFLLGDRVVDAGDDSIRTCISVRKTLADIGHVGNDLGST